MAASHSLERRLLRPGADQLDVGPDIRVARLAADEWGVLSTRELRACGLSGDAVTHRVRKGLLHRMHRGVYAVGHANPPLEGYFLAAVKACGPGTRLSHYAGAAHWEFLGWDDRPPEVTVVGAATRLHRGIRVHRTIALDPVDCVRHRGIPITSPARTLVDLASVLGYRPLRRAVR